MEPIYDYFAIANPKLTANKIARTQVSKRFKRFEALSPIK